MTIAIIVFFIIFIPLTCIAGVDFSMMGGGKDKSKYVVPYFEKKIDAINYANKVKWNEEILEAFKKAEFDAYYDRYDRHVGWFNDMYTPNRYREYWECLDLAIYIMEDYKKKGEKGDPAMVGSLFYAGMEPIKKCPKK